MAKKKKKKVVVPKKVVKKYPPNRYNIFQRELSAYLKESGGTKTDFKKYKGLYKDLDKTIPVKRIGEYLPVMLKKFTEQKIVNTKLLYEERFPFYQAKSELSLPKYGDVVLEVGFDDTVEGNSGGFKFEWSGTQQEFFSWFSGDVMAYFRNNYNDSPPAEFVLKEVDGKTLKYRIEVGASIVGTPAQVPVASGLVVRDKAARTGVTPGTGQDTVVFMEKQTELIKQWRELGYTNEEIKAKIKLLEESFYGKRTK